MDAFASAFGFFLVGFDFILGYVSEDCPELPSFGVQKPLLWVFQVWTLVAVGEVECVYAMVFVDS